VIGPDLEWRYITTRQEARVLQRFTCTTDPPRTPGGRPLRHDRPWEREAQSHLRQASQRFKPGDLILLGTLGNEVVAAAHLELAPDTDILQVFIAAVGVALTERRQGGFVADRMLAAIQAEGLARATVLGCTHLVIAGNIHTSNAASQNMVQRAGWEPYDAPGSPYQSWGLIVPI
jgi:hypothetical protein